MGWRIALTELALSDLNRAVASGGEALGLELAEQIYALADFPWRGVRVDLGPSLRQMSHSHFQIVYRIDEAQQRIDILRVWDPRRDRD